MILSGGTDDRPLSGKGVVPFISPESLEVQFRLPHRGMISGMLIPKGVTVITGLQSSSELKTLPYSICHNLSALNFICSDFAYAFYGSIFSNIILKFIPLPRWGISWEKYYIKCAKSWNIQQGTWRWSRVCCH